MPLNDTLVLGGNNMKKLVLGINSDLTNREYHADKSYLSSTQLKKILDNPKQFNDERLGLVEPKLWNKTALEDGTLTHSMILEPETLESEFVFWNGWTKRGKEYEAIVEANPEKLVISLPQKTRVEGYVKAFNRRKAAVQLLTGGQAELSFTAIIDDVPLKVRCDYINIDAGYIADVKTTSYPVEIAVFKNTVNQLKYHLSGALYCMVAEKVFNKSFDFYFVAISKKELVCEVYKLSDQLKTEGSILVLQALETYKLCMKTGNWESKKPKIPVTDSDYEILEV